MSSTAVLPVLFIQYVDMVGAAGGSMNMPKSQAWSPSPGTADHPAVVDMAGLPQLDGSVLDGIDMRPATGGIRCLGHPLGTDEYVRTYLADQAAGTGQAVALL